MTNATETLEFFDPATASDHELEALLAFTNGLRSEMTPDDPPTPFAEAIATWRATSPLMSNATWLIRSGEGEVLARGHAAYANTTENRQLVQASIQVRADRRRQGLGRRLLGSIAARMRENGRTLAMAATSDRAPGGAAFLEGIGAERGLEGHVHQLAVAELDRAVLGEWQARARDRADAFESGFWDGPFPEDQLATIGALHEVMNTQPTGSRGRTSALHARLLLIEQTCLHADRAPRDVRARMRPARFAGFELYWKPTELLSQGNTGVFPSFTARTRALAQGGVARALACRASGAFRTRRAPIRTRRCCGLIKALGFHVPLTHGVGWSSRRSRLSPARNLPNPRGSGSPLVVVSCEAAGPHEPRAEQRSRANHRGITPTAHTFRRFSA
jgi:GNAT superfamily N-acetyltransferase